jgi:hypothetical protein
LLNEPIEYRPDCNPSRIVHHEEIAVPVFTLPGNHDVRVHGYSLPAMGYYKYFGMTYIEALLYKDPIKLSTERALVVDKYCLKPYYQHINPFDDYFIRFGNRFFIMLNSGADSFLNIKSLLMANPGCVGLKDTQIAFIHRVFATCSSTCGDSSTGFFVSHSPILNPSVKGALWKALRSMFNGKKYVPPEFYKESNLKERGRTDTNITDDLNFDIGTISKNRERILKFLYKNRLTAISGHTHMQREFRFRLCGAENVCDPLDMDELVRKHLLEITWDDYTDNEKPAFVQDNRPFIFHTPSLGIRRLDEKREYGAFRMISLLGDRLEDIQVRHLSSLANDF